MNTPKLPSEVMKRRKFIASATTALVGANSYAQAKQPRIRIGQIGLAHPHALGKLKGIQSLPEVYELVGVVEPDLSLRKRAKGVNFVSMEQLMNAKGLQAVAIETRVKDLVTTALPVVDAGKHIHLDKPAGENLEGFQNSLQVYERIRSWLFLLVQRWSIYEQP